MSRSLLAAVVIALALPTVALAGEGNSLPALPSLSGKVDSQSAERRSGGRGRSAQRGRSGGQPSRNDSADRSSGQGSRPPADDRGGDERRSDRPAGEGQGRPDEGRSDQGPPEGSRERSAEPQRGRPAPDQPGDRAGGPRPVDTSRPGPHDRPQGAQQGPVNYRGVSRNGVPAHASAGRTGPSGPRSSEVARSHRHAASAQAPHRGGPSRGHSEASRWRHNWTRHHYSRPSWHRPVTWFSPWYAGHPHHWYHGVFVYGPAPWYRSPGPSEPAPPPKRKVNHEGQFSLGVRAGSYLSGYTNKATYGDFGLGIAGRYRPVEPLGLELQWNYHDYMWSEGTPRIQQPLSASVELFMFPWSRVNPYALAGLTLTSRNIQDDIGSKVVDSHQAFFGPHGGVGLELGLSKKTSVNFDARWIGYLNLGEGDSAYPGAAQANMGLNFYF